MNKKIWGIAGPAAMAMGLALSACGGGNADRLDVCYEEYDYLSVACKTEGDSLAADSALITWRCEAEGVLPLKIGKLDIKQLRDTLMALGAVDLDGSKAVAKLPAGYKAAPDTHPDSVESVVANNLSVVLVNPRVMVWRCYHYAYPAGAAHGTYSDTYINYSTEGDGKVLSLADIFRKGAESQLLEMVRAQLAERDDLLVELSEVKLPANFRVTDEGVDFIFGLYEVAPYSSGEIEVELNAYALAHLLTDWAKTSLFQLSGRS